ncbi:UTP--glucose-1-phosphate uridylyltransferase GalU [Peribacillus deserti]|uniref:UTP--glucose-1-phosphate uridylyltransferase n=1 Tax=Peribacillus deserti TaxID=673318 RepID=A0A2N5M898_9BACI|nr:UTP--glucose-1-phosphate uridylyltransferase GalU [Peribacillus deserti]PLT30580.1 UTP--glucose-1-phosphate uridylyltransferase [Peribacillus deserti]
MKVKKAVIPVAGLGTRFLPATKAQPKEMLPIVDKPAVQYIVEEAVQSGIESIIFVTGRNKKSIEDHFDKSAELEQLLESKEKYDMLEQVKQISSLAHIHYIRQKEPLGLGHAILCAQAFVGNEPFAVLLGDDIMVSETPALKQLIDAYESFDRQVIGVQQVEPSEVSKYGIIRPGIKRNTLYTIRDLVEKPSISEAPSNIAVMGRYILKPSIFPILERTARGAGNEIQLTDALREAKKEEQLLALELNGKRFDIGDKLGYIKAITEVGLKRPELRMQLLSYLEDLLVQETAAARK